MPPLEYIQFNLRPPATYPAVPCTEDFPTAALNPYGRTKLFIEHILSDLQAGETRGPPSTALAPFTPPTARKAAAAAAAAAAFKLTRPVIIVHHRV